MIYRVTYQSMTAFYGPTFIEAESEAHARRKFAGDAFRQEEMCLINVKPSSMREAMAHASPHGD